MQFAAIEQSRDVGTTRGFSCVHILDHLSHSSYSIIIIITFQYFFPISPSLLSYNGRQLVLQTQITACHIIFDKQYSKPYNSTSSEAQGKRSRNTLIRVSIH